VTATGDPRPRPWRLGVVAAATVAYEILLVRVFAIQYFYHFAYMAIGVAMLGIGVSGVVMALRSPHREAAAATWFPAAVFGTVVSLLVAPLIAQRITLDPAQLPWDPTQWLRLGVIYIILALPFLMGGLATVAALRATPDRVGMQYGASFLGSGLGAAVALSSLRWLAPAQALAMPCVVAAVALPGITFPRTSSRHALEVILVIVGVAAVAYPPWRLEVTPYKALPQVQHFPNAHRIDERFSPIGWFVAIDADAFRHAPGLSLSYTGALPHQTALFVDGDLAGALGRVDDSTDISEWLPAAIPHLATSPQRVLVLGAGGDTEVRTALHYGASGITAVDLHPGIVAMAKARDAVLQRGAAIRWVAGDPREYVERAHAAFDLITLPPVGGLGSAAAGTQGLAEDFLHTVDAYRTMVARLSPTGALAVTRWIEVPPRGAVRTILTVSRGLRDAGYDDVASRLVVVRGWATVTVLARPAGFVTSQLDDLRTWCLSRGFDFDWPLAERRAEGFNQLDDSSIRDAVEAAAAGRRPADAFARSYTFDVTPSTDSRPFPHHYAGASALRTILREGPGAALPVTEWGYIALVATLAQAVVAGAALLLLPVSLTRHPPSRSVPTVAYFSAIGIAYMSAEIAAIQQLRLLVGHPVYAVTVVLVIFLVASGLGSITADRARVGPRQGASILAVAFAMCAALLLPTVHLIQRLGIGSRLAFTVLVLAPVAYLMGRPFPEGVGKLGDQSSADVAWAWAANGFASVVAAPFAALAALELGSGSVFLVAAAAYAAAAVAQPYLAPPATV
jgi:hypothetical protein